MLFFFFFFSLYFSNIESRPSFLLTKVFRMRILYLGIFDVRWRGCIRVFLGVQFSSQFFFSLYYVIFF